MKAYVKATGLLQENLSARSADAARLSTFRIIKLVLLAFALHLVAAALSLYENHSGAATPTPTIEAQISSVMTPINNASLPVGLSLNAQLQAALNAYRSGRYRRNVRGCRIS